MGQEGILKICWKKKSIETVEKDLLEPLNKYCIMYSTHLQSLIIQVRSVFLHHLLE